MRKFAAWLNRGLLLLTGLLALLYAGDYVSLRFSIPARPQTRGVQVQPLLAVPQKGNKVEYILGDPRIDTCSVSLFPQLGHPPCWYVERHTNPRVDM